MSYHCKNCGRNLREKQCPMCDKPGVFKKGDIVRVTPIGLTECETKDFKLDERMTVSSMGGNNGNGPYVVFEDSCPMCHRQGISHCRGHWTGAKTGINYMGASNFEVVA